MSAPRTVPPAPAPAPVPLPNPQKPPTGKKYSEGSMYEDLSAEDIEAWHRRYSEFRKWRQEIPNKNPSSMSLGQGVGVGSADWDWKEPSECGTIPSTIVERAWKNARATTTNNLGPQAELPAPTPPKSNLSKKVSNMNLQARVETLRSGSETPPSNPPSGATTIRPPLSQKPLPPQNITNNQNTVKVRTPTIEIQPPSTKLPTQKPLPSNKPAQSQKPTPAPSNHPTSSKIPTPSQKPTPSAKLTRPPPTPLLAQSPNHEKSIRPTSEPKLTSHPPSRGSNVPGEQIIPSPTPSTKYAEREAYIASALSFPLEMLTETEGIQPNLNKSNSSSQFTTGRLDSLLGKNNSKSKGSQRSNGSSTTLPSVRSDRPLETPSQVEMRNSQLGRSKTTSAVPMKSKVSERSMVDHTSREHHYEGSNHLPTPGAVPTRSRTPSDATIVQAAKQPLPPSTHVQSKASTITPTKSVKPTQSQATNPGRQSQQPTQAVPSEATVIRAAREPLPLSVASTATPHETIKIPVSVKTAISTSGPAIRAPPTEATIIRAVQVPLPPTIGRTGTIKSSTSTIKHVPESRADPTSPRNIALPPTALTGKSTVISEIAPTHRQQMPLPRPALTPQPSFDGLTKATSLGRKHRDPSVGDLTAHFAPNLYPLPPSGATLFSSPEQVASLRPNSAIDHEVAFSTVQYIPPESFPSTTVASTPAVLPSNKSKSNKSVIPPTPMYPALAIPLPPSTAVLSTKSALKATPSAPAPSSASPPAPPAPPVTSPVHLVPAVLTIPIPPPTQPAQPTQPSQPISHRESHHPIEAVPAIHDSSRLPPQDPPHIHFSPGQVSQSLRSDDDHVSFEVPSGSRGRLRVTLKWFRDSTRSDRGSPRATRLSVVQEDGPPPLPPKTSSLMSRVIGKSQDDKASHPPSSNHRTSQHDQSRQSEHSHQARQSENSHPLPENERPRLSPPPPKRDNPKSPSASDEYPPNQQSQQQHHPSGPAPYYNPYYSGATLPAYAAAMPQVYNMFSPPMAYPQPGLPNWNAAGPYRPTQPPVPQPGMMGRQAIDPSSPARESVDPPSDVDLPLPPPPPPQHLGGYTTGIMGVNGYPIMQNPQAQYWNNMSRPSIWQRMFRKPDQQDQDMDNLGPDDSVTIRNWRKGVIPGGKTPTMLPNRNGVSTIIPQQSGGGRPTIIPTAYPGMNNTISGPGTTLYNARGGYPSLGRDGRRGRGENPSIWEKLMYRRQTEEAIYRSPPRRRRDLPDPAPGVTPSRFGNDRSKGIFTRNKSRADKVRDRNGNPIQSINRIERVSGRGKTTGEIRRKEKIERYEKRQKDKEERRRQRSLRRDQRVNTTTQNQYQYQINPNGLRREQFVVVDPKDRPNDLGGHTRGGRSGTLVGDWVGRFGGGRSRQQFPNPDSQVRNYQPKLWKDRLNLSRRTTTPLTPGAANQTTYTQTRNITATQPQGRRQTLRRTNRTTNRVIPNSLGLNTGQGQMQNQNQGMRGMIGRLNLGRRDGVDRNRR